MAEIFKCKKCGHIFRRKQDLRRHLNNLIDCKSGSKTNKNIVKYKCDYCKKDFNRKDNKNRHMKTCTKNKSADKIKIKNNGDVAVTKVIITTHLLKSSHD